MGGGGRKSMFAKLSLTAKMTASRELILGGFRESNRNTQPAHEDMPLLIHRHNTVRAHGRSLLLQLLVCYIPHGPKIKR